MNEALTPRLSKWQRNAWIIGSASLAACLLGGLFSHARAYQAYWFAWIFWTGLGLGALSMLMLQCLTGGAWGQAVQPPAQAAMLTLPVMALLMIPVFFGMADIFPWAHAGALHADWHHKQRYLTVPWFIARAAGFFIVMILLAVLLRVRSQEGSDRPGTQHFSAPMRSISGAGLLAYSGCMIFASTDWIMSLEPRWYSTMLVVIVMAGQFLAALAFSTVLVIALANTNSSDPSDPSDASPTPKELHDLGNLLLAFTTFWIYVSFSQYLIIWSGNLPREISWYLHRKSGGWETMAACLAAFGFGVPFALLLSRAAKRNRQRLLPIAALIFAANVVHVYWLISPSFNPSGVHVHWLDAAAFAGIGGLWLAAFLEFFKRRPLITMMQKKGSV